MAGKAFVDTNVLLRATVVGLELHAEAVQLMFQQRAASVELWISRQVLREYMVQVTRPQNFMKPMTVAQLEADLRTFQSTFEVADETAAVTAQLVALLKEYPTGGKQIHDANIVATMLVNVIDTLLTGNIEDMKRFEDKITLIPLKADSQK